MMGARKLRQAEEKITEQEVKLEKAQQQLHAVGQWVHAMLQRHQPYVAGRIDVSTETGDAMTAELLEVASRQLFCTGCPQRWPCSEIPKLRLLREAICPGADMGDVLDRIEAIKSKPRIGLIETAM